MVSVLPFRQCNENMNPTHFSDTPGYASNSVNNSDISDNVTSNTVSISMELYKKLVQTSMDLIKANRTIEKLNELIRMKDAVIEKLKVGEQNAHLTPVS